MVALPPAAVVWKDAGNSGPPYSSANLPWSYLATLACGTQMSGPTLNPGTFEQALLSGACNGGGWRDGHNPKRALVQFGKGDYTALSDARQVWWDPNAPSKIDGKKGAYVDMDGGRRYAIGDWTPGEPVLPGRS